MLQKFVVSVPFTGGVDSKTAEKLVRQGFFLDLQNIVRRKSGALAKRFGFGAYSSQIAGTPTSITIGNRLTTFINDLVLIDNTNLYSYSPASMNWNTRGPVISATVQSVPMIRNSAKQAQADIASFGGLTTTCWEDSRGGVGCSVTDDTSGSVIVSDFQISSTGSRPKVVGFNGHFVVTYYESGVLKCATIPVVNPSAITTNISIQAGMTDDVYDTCILGNNGVFVFNTVAGLKLGYFTASGIAGSPAVNTLPSPMTLTDAGTDCVACFVDSSRNFIYVGYHDSAGPEANKVRLCAITGNFLVSSYQTIEALAGITNITGTLLANNDIALFYEVSAVDVKNYSVRESVSRFNGATLSLISGGSTLVRSVGLVSKAYTIGGSLYVTVTHESVLQSTYFVIKQTGATQQAIARMQAGLGGGLTRDTDGNLKSSLSRVTVDSSGNYICAVQVRNRLTTESATTQASYVGINKQVITYNAFTYNTDTIGQNLHIAGSMLLMYDGVSTVEHGFNLSPEDLTFVAGGVGSITGPNCRAVALYEWVDGQGQIHRSATSVSPASIAVANGQTLSVTVPTLRITQKTGNRADARIVVYRTIANGTSVYYRDVDSFNDPTADTVTLVCTQADDTLQQQEILYTVGGVLNNDPAPACSAVHKHKGRLYLLGLEDQNGFAFSKQQISGEGIAFSDGFRKTVDPRGGPVRCGATLDDKMIFFKDTAMFYQVGDGPLDTGQQDDTTEPQLISSDVGCSNPRSIAIMPSGVMFQSKKGIYLLDRGLGTSYIGAPVEKHNNLTVTSATVIESDSEVRFTTSTGVCLVYNYLFSQWSTFSNYASADATSFLGSYLHLTQSGVVNSEIADIYNDNGQTYGMRIETNWFNLGNIQGFQRIYRWALLGDFLAHCKARVQVAYNYEDAYNETVYFNTQSGLGTDTFGSDATYGSSTVYGGQGSSVFQFRSKPRRQKCESIKLLIEDLDTLTPSGGGSFSLVSLSFEAAQKQGMFKMGNNKTRGGN